MGKVFRLAMLVVALWAGLTIYLDGVEGLTGEVGSLVSQSSGDGNAPERPRSLPQRIGDSVDAEMKKREQQYAQRVDPLDDF